MAATPTGVIDKRMANALFKGAKANMVGKMALGVEGRIGMSVVEKAMGGVWVGGTVYLTSEAVEFRPNFINRATHANSDALAVTAPLKDVTRVEIRPGLITKIVDVAYGEDQMLTFRCYKSEAFLEAIEKAWDAAKDAA